MEQAYQHWTSLTLAEPFLSFRIGWADATVTATMAARMQEKRIFVD